MGWFKPINKTSLHLSIACYVKNLKIQFCLLPANLGGRPILQMGKLRHGRDVIKSVFKQYSNKVSIHPSREHKPLTTLLVSPQGGNSESRVIFCSVWTPESNPEIQRQSSPLSTFSVSLKIQPGVHLPFHLWAGNNFRPVVLYSSWYSQLFSLEGKGQYWFFL